MKVLYIHNDYYRPSGEEHAAEALVAMLREHGHEVVWYRRSSAELQNMFMGSLKAAFLSIYNPKAIKDIKRIIREQKPDLVQVQNLYPLISPRVLKTIKAEGIPVVMRCPNYRLFCPTGLFLDPMGNICEKCTGIGHESWCIRKNCMGTRSKSAAYALRNYFARITNVFLKYVDAFIVQSEFQRNKFIEFGIPAEKIAILPGITPNVELNIKVQNEKYITFVGRVSREKGIDDFIEAARQLPHLKFAIAGNIPDDIHYNGTPANINWLGFINGNELAELYDQSIVVIVPSKWYEGFPNVITRAMYHAKPVITTNVGCFPNIIEQGLTGFMYSPGNIDELAMHIQYIVDNPERAKIIGLNGLEKAKREYSNETIYNKLISIFNSVLKIEVN